MSFGLLTQEVMWGKIAIVAFVLLGLCLAFRLPKEHCVCGLKIPEGGGMCECGDYNGRAVINIDTPCDSRQKVFEQELKRIEEEKRKGMITIPFCKSI